MSTTAVGWAPIIKADKQADGTLIITGKAADSSVDRDLQIADPAWLDKALGQWYGEADGGNIREQHDGKRAVGRAIEYRKSTDGGHHISAHIVDPTTVLKIENKVLRGFSWSARNARVQVDKAAAGGRIMDGQIYEVSVVDRPANPQCLFTIAKADSDGDLVDVDEPVLVVNIDKLDAADVQAKARGVLDEVRALVPGLDLSKSYASAVDEGNRAEGEEQPGDAMNGLDAIAAIARLIVSEAESLAEGNLNELWDIQILLDAACALRCFVGNEMREETMAETAKTEDATEDTETVAVDKTVTESDTGQALSEVVTKAITEATQPLRDELTLVKAELAKVNATPIPGGPARVRTAGHTAVAAKADEIRRDIEDLRKSVDRTQDRTLRSGYQERLAAREADLAKLDS